MGKTTRKRYGAEFKAKVALEAIRGELTLSPEASDIGSVIALRRSFSARSKWCPSFAAKTARIIGAQLSFGSSLMIRRRSSRRPIGYSLAYMDFHRMPAGRSCAIFRNDP